MGLLPWLYNYYRKIAYVNSFLKATKNPSNIQEKILLAILQKNRDTEYGKEYNFHSIKSVREFQEAVPIQEYDKFHRYIEAIKNGKRNVLTHDDVTFFATTSGTMGSPKFIPATEYTIKQYAKNFQIFFYFAFKDHPKMFDRKLLSVVSKSVKAKTQADIPYGSISGLVYATEPFFVKRLYVIPHEVFSIEDYDSRYYCIVRFALEEDISFIITPNPSTILHLCEIAIKYKNMIINDIEMGTLAKDLKISPVELQILSRYVKKNPQRASHLRSLVKQGKFSPLHYWPNLKFIVCWKEGTLGHFITQLNKHFGEIPIRDLGLIASEAHCSIPISDSLNSGVLNIDTNFFEFIDVEKNTVCTVGELEMDKQYSLVITNHAGLYRYHLQDIVKVVGYLNKTPIIHFIDRGDNVQSITGEKLTEWQVVNAVKHALSRYSISLHHFTFYANSAGKGSYDIFVELLKPTDGAVLKLFLKEVEAQLAKLNMEYSDKRASKRLGPPKLKVVEPLCFRKMHRAKSIVQGQDSQIKLPVLTGDKNFKHLVTVIREIKL